MMDRIAPELTRYYVIRTTHQTVLAREAQGLLPITVGRLEARFRIPGLSHCHSYFLRLFSGIDRSYQVYIDTISGYLMVRKPFSLIGRAIPYPPD